MLAPRVNRQGSETRILAQFSVTEPKSGAAFFDSSRLTLAPTPLTLSFQRKQRRSTDGESGIGLRNAAFSGDGP